MSESTAEVTQDGNASGATSAADEFKPITSQEDLNRIIGDRVKRVESKYADYEDLKAKGAQLDALAEASKTEAEKTAERIAQAEAEVASVPSKVADALREHLIELHQIDQEQAELFLTASDPQLLLRQVTALLGQADTRKKNANIVPREGTSTRPADNEEASFARNLFAGD
jgi:hypothetical protein